MVTDSFFGHVKSSIMLTEFITELNENVDMYGEIFYFAENVNTEDDINLIKIKAKIPFKLKKDIQNNHCHSSLPKQ